ncbi:MAG: flagellar hook-associated protein FlgK [Candidatus Omnitrophota bacterium]
MVSLFGILNIGTQGIFSAQAGLDATGQNITNANTDGYSRQRVVQQASNPLVTPQGAYGQGVEVVTIERIRDLFLEGQIRSAQSDVSYNEELENTILRIEGILSDPLASITDTADQSSTGGLNNLLSRFFQAFHELSLTPEAPELRTAAIESAISLADTINTISEQLNTLRSDLNDRVSLMVEDLNRMSDEIAQLNHNIVLTESKENVKANDLRDRRDLLLSQMSEMIPITTSEDENGAVSVAVGGQRIVDGVQTKELKLEVVEKANGVNIVSIRVGENGLYTLDDKIRKGELGGVLDARDRIVPFLQQDIDELARGIINEVNKIHSGAAGLEGYSSLRSHFAIPEGAESPSSKLTLDEIFNHPSLPKDAPLGDYPYAIQEGSFSIRVSGADDEIKDEYEVKVGLDDTLTELVERIDRSDGIVAKAQSALSFNPVYVSEVTAQQGAKSTELNVGLGLLSSSIGYPISEQQGNFSLEIHIRDSAGREVDSDAAAEGVQPFTVTFTNADTLESLATKIQTAAGGRVRANLVPSEDDPNVSVLKLQTVNNKETFSIQNDDSGIFRAFEFPMTDPTVPLIGGNAERAAGTFQGDPADTFLGAGNPSFSPAFPGPPPSVISDGSFELVVLDNNNTPTVTTITISNSAINTMNDLAQAISQADANLDVTVDGGELVINSSNYRSFFFQNDTTGLIDALGFQDIDGFGKIGDQPFTDGSFEVVVANETGMVTSIFEVPIQADPSVVGGVMSLQDIVDNINQAAGTAGAPVVASIAVDPQNPSLNRIQIDAARGFEFTFRSDDSLVLSALGFTDGPVLAQTLDNPISGAEYPIAIGDNIGGLVRAKMNETTDFQIYTSTSERIAFGADSSHVLAAAGINALFFGSDGQSMRVNDAIVENVNLLAVSSDGSAGNNEAALAIADLENEGVIGGKSLAESYRSMISQLGMEGSRATQFFQTNEKILSELKGLREQDSGVSLDEESVNLIRYQQAYQASARVITTVNTLLDLIVSQLGP